MRRLTDTQYLIIGLVGLVVVALIIALVNPTQSEPGSLSARSDERDGALALRLWLEEIGYGIRTFTDEVRLSELDALLVLNPPSIYDESEGETVRDWVAQGGRLIVAGRPFRTVSLLAVFEVEMGDFSFGQGDYLLSTPLLQSPPVERLPGQRGLYTISTMPDNAVTLAATAQAETVLVAFPVGQGEVWVSGTSYPFTNIGLQEPDSPELILNMLSGLPQGAVIGFDEALRLENPPSLLNWLFNTPPGWGIVLGMALTMTFLAFRGRRFGRAVPLPEDRLLREPNEYIQAMANLYRRSGQRKQTLQHYKTQLRRALCERYGLRPTINDSDLVHTVANRNPDIDKAELTELFQQLSAEQITEQELVSVALAADEWQRKYIG